eukprot:scaffold1966_cov131-Skeletonema_marinoi.AAC.2
MQSIPHFCRRAQEGIPTKKLPLSRASSNSACEKEKAYLTPICIASPRFSILPASLCEKECKEKKQRNKGSVQFRSVCG